LERTLAAAAHAGKHYRKARPERQRGGKFARDLASERRRQQWVAKDGR